MARHTRFAWKMQAIFLLFLLPLALQAQEVTSPNGNVRLIFSLDGTRPAYRITRKTVKQGDKLTIHQAPGGGFAMSLRAVSRDTE